MRMLALVFLAGCATTAPAVQLQPVESHVIPSSPIVKATAPDHSLLEGVAKGNITLASLVDGGVVFIDESGDPSDGEAVRDKPGMKCGPALEPLLVQVKQRIADQLGQPEDERVECDGTSCILGGRSEWDPTVHLVFRNKPDGALVLRAIAYEDEVLVQQEQVAKNRAEIPKAIERLERKC